MAEIIGYIVMVCGGFILAAQGPGRAEEGKGKDQIVNNTVETATVIVLWMIIAYLMWRD